MVLVPFPGSLYFYLTANTRAVLDYCSRPLSGVSLFLLEVKL